MLNSLFTVLNRFSLILALVLLLYAFWLSDYVADDWIGLTDTLFWIVAVLIIVTKGYAIYASVQKQKETRK
jgi:Ca2+/Na+ antiporter